MDFNFQQTNKRELFFGKPWTYSDNILANNQTLHRKTKQTQNEKEK